MKKMMTTLLASGMLISGAFAADPAPKANPAQAPEVKEKSPAELFAFLPEVVAKINGKDLTRAEVVTAFVADLPDGKLPPFVTEEMLKQMAPQMVRGLVSQRLLGEAAEKAGFKASEQSVKDFFSGELKKLKPEELDTIKEQLKMQNKTMESYIAEVSKNPQAQRQIAISRLMEKEVGSKIVIADKDVKEYYDKNPNMFVNQADAPDGIRASHILIMVPKDATAAQKAEAKKKIEDILAQVKKDGAKFEALAEAMSECPSGKEAKGSLGAFGRGQMVKAFEDVAFGLKEGEISGIVETEFGYHVIRRDAKKEAKPIPFAEVKEELTNFLKRQKMEEANAAYVAKLEKDNKVEILLPEAPVALPAAK